MEVEVVGGVPSKVCSDSRCRRRGRRLARLRPVLLLGFLVCFAITSATAARAGSPHAEGTHHRFLLHAGARFQRVGTFDVRRDPTYRGAISAFGDASECRLVQRSPDAALATWRSLGIRIRLATLGSIPEGESGCTAPDLIHIDRIEVTGRQWHTTRGLRVGESGYRLRQLYPDVKYRPLSEPFFPNAYFLVAVRERCVIGICDAPYVTAPRLVAKMRDGRVVAFVFPVGAQGE